MPKIKYPSHLQNQALCMLAAGCEVKEVSEKLGIARKTIYSWQENPEFQKLLNEGVARIYDAAIAELVSNVQVATRELVKIIQAEDTPKRVKVSAISTLLQYATRAKDAYQEDLVRELDNEIRVNVNFNDDSPCIDTTAVSLPPPESP